MHYPEPLSKLIAALGRLPGIGPKTAQRLAFHLLKVPANEARSLAAAILEARQKTIYCSICGNYTDQDPCRLCSDPERDHACICVVEEAQDIMALEKTRQYRGVYHVLQGAISPVDGIGPEQLRIKELLARVQDGRVREVILATNADVEGESTALYLDKLLKNMGVKVTRLAYGLPVGGDLEYADEVTLARAFAGRREIE
ncbi:MAG: recombination protein RecR [Moorella sp. (in: firmicutes)]|nr:recombination protein RecR [Moorella sp. (in: firmicutes)]